MKTEFVVVAVVAVISYTTFNNLVWLDVYQHTYNHSPGACRQLTGVEPGSEDIQVLPNGLAFISSGWRVKPTNAMYKRRPGNIYLFDFNKPQNEPQRLAIKAADSSIQLISPHGISLWTNKQTGVVYVYVISHQKVETVDKFQFDAKSLSLLHVRRIHNDSNFHILNDLTVVGEDQFYFTNFFYWSDLFELTAGLRWGSIGFYDGKQSTIVDTGLFVPNGLTVSHDSRYLYVAQLGDEDIRVYRRYNNNSITFLHSIKLWTKVDNLDVDVTTGDLWVGAHPVAYQILNYLDNPTLTSPSQVLRLQMFEGQAVNIEEMYSNNGTQISASSVAVRYKAALLIGSVASQTLYCRLTQEEQMIG